MYEDTKPLANDLNNYTKGENDLMNDAQNMLNNKPCPNADQHIKQIQQAADQYNKDAPAWLNEAAGNVAGDLTPPTGSDPGDLGVTLFLNQATSSGTSQ